MTTGALTRDVRKEISGVLGAVHDLLVLLIVGGDEVVVKKGDDFFVTLVVDELAVFDKDSLTVGKANSPGSNAER